MAPDVTVKTVDWPHVLASARPLLLVAIDLLLRTKKLKPYKNALHLISVAVDRLIPVDVKSDSIDEIRKTHAELAALGNASPAKRRALLEKLHVQLSAL